MRKAAIMGKGHEYLLKSAKIIGGFLAEVLKRRGLKWKVEGTGKKRFAGVANISCKSVVLERKTERKNICPVRADVAERP